MFHIWTLIPALYVLFRFIRPLPPGFGKNSRRRHNDCGLRVSYAHEIIYGEYVFSRIPKPLLLLTTGLFGMTVFYGSPVGTA